MGLTWDCTAEVYNEDVHRNGDVRHTEDVFGTPPPLAGDGWHHNTNGPFRNPFRPLRTDIKTMKPELPIPTPAVTNGPTAAAPGVIQARYTGLNIRVTPSSGKGRLEYCGGPLRPHQVSGRPVLQPVAASTAVDARAPSQCPHHLGADVVLGTGGQGAGRAWWTCVCNSKNGVVRQVDESGTALKLTHRDTRG